MLDFAGVLFFDKDKQKLSIDSKNLRIFKLTFRKSARNFGPVMAMAARKTVASVYEKADLGGIDPETVITPGIFVHAVVHIPRVATQAGGI